MGEKMKSTGKAENQIDKRQHDIGMASAIFCATLWGILPVYWKSIEVINPLVIMLYRMVMVCIVVFIAVLVSGKLDLVKAELKKKNNILIFALAGLVISTNWSLYIYMINSGRIVHTSIGYYIEPLVVCAFGMIFFHERPNRNKMIAIGLAVLGVFIMLLSFGQLPVLAILLAMSFAVYAAIKKKVQAPALISLFFETVFLAPVAVAIIIYLELHDIGALSTAGTKEMVLLSLSGLLTATPLTLFAIAANRISLFALGLTEYISPSLGLVIGIFIYKESFDLYQLMGFVVIWIGLVVFTYDDFFASKKVEKLSPHAEGKK